MISQIIILLINRSIERKTRLGGKFLWYSQVFIEVLMIYLGKYLKYKSRDQKTIMYLRFINSGVSGWLTREKIYKKVAKYSTYHRNFYTNYVHLTDGNIHCKPIVYKHTFLSRESFLALYKKV